MTAYHPYHHTPAILADYRRRARWRRRLAMARRIGGAVLREAVWVYRIAVTLLWLEVVGAGMAVALLWRMG